MTERCLTSISKGGHGKEKYVIDLIKECNACKIRERFRVPCAKLPRVTSTVTPFEERGLRMRTITRFLVCVGAAIWIAGQSSAAIQPKDFVLAWPLNEGAGDTAKDIGENGNNGKFVGDAKWAEGKFGKGVELKAKGNVQSATSKGVSPLLMSECLWVNFSDLAPENQFGYISSSGAASTRFFYFSTWCAAGPPHNCIHLGTVDLGGAWGRGIVTAGLFDKGKWYYVCGVINNEEGTIKAFVDGKEVHSQGFGKGPSPGTPTTIWVGNSPEDYQPITGVVDEVGFFNIALTGNDITSLMKDGIGAGLAVEARGKVATVWGTLKQPK